MRPCPLHCAPVTAVKSASIDTMSRNDSRPQILDAALALIARRGEADVTMAEIAKAARVSRQAVYLNFADRGDLLLALVRYVDEKRSLVEELKKSPAPPLGWLLCSKWFRYKPG